MIWHRLLIGLLATGIGIQSASAQQYRIDAWTADNGLPSNPVNRVLQTKDGFIWLATFAGLVRYDGARFEVFNTGTTSELRSSRFTDLFEDRQGNLWAATEGQGLARHADGVFHLYTTAEGIPDNTARDFFYDEDGRLLLDSQKGVAEWTGERFVPYTGAAPSVSRADVRSPFRMGPGVSWYLAGSTARKFERGRVTREVPLPNDTRWIFEDSRGRLWVEDLVRDVRFLMLVEDGKLRRFSAADGIPAFRTMSLFEDRRGAIWFGLQGNGGLLRYQDGRFTRYTTADGLPGNNVGKPFQDREGTLWVPTDGGLARLTERVVAPFTVTDGLSSDNVYPVYQDRRGTVWIGGWMGLTQYKDGVFRSAGHGYGVDRANVMSLFEDREGAFWIGLWGGGVYRAKGGVVEKFPQRPAGDVVRAIEQDATGDVWLGGNAGLTRYSRGQFRRFTSADGFTDATVLAIRPGRDGRVWIGTDAGLSEYRNGVFTNYGAREGLTGNVVRSLYEDRAGVLWAGTYDTGLFRFENGTFTRLTTREGLFDNGAFQILEDPRGNFWISSNAGIYRVARSSLDDVAGGRARSVLSIPYGKRDGMITAECNGGGQPAGILAQDGRLWFPTQKGVVVIDAEHLAINEVPPPVVITGLTIDRDTRPVADRIEVQPGQTAFEINYAGLTFVQPELTRFRYKLEDLDTEWVEAGGRRTAYFSHVPFGSYRFVVTAANRDGIWNETGVSIPVSVIPPFWRTGWFQMAVGLVVLGAVAALYRRRILAMERTQAMRDEFSRQLIDSQEAERKRIAAELHDSVGQTLIVINNWALAGINAAPAGDEQKARWNEVSSTASAAINEVREIAYNLGPYQLDRLGLADTILEMVDRVSSASGIRFEADIADVDRLMLKESEISVYRIVQESVNNIVKHSQATEVALTMRVEGEVLILTIQDNGRGFDSVAASLPGPRKQGFGLQGLAERARMLGGTFEIRSAHGTGTRLTIHVPVESPM